MGSNPTPGAFSSTPCIDWAIARHFRQGSLKVHVGSIKLGNAAIDGEVIGSGWKMALEIKSSRDDIVRGIGQIAAKAFGYDSVALVTSLRAASRINPTIFTRMGLVLLGVDSTGRVHQVYPV